MARTILRKGLPRDPSVPWRTGTVQNHPDHPVAVAWNHWLMAWGAKPHPLRDGQSSLGQYAADHLKVRFARLTTARSIVHALSRDVGPVLVGGLEYRDMAAPTVEGYINATGPLTDAGTTAFAVMAYSPKRRAFRVLGCRGVRWGQTGRAWISLWDMDRLLTVGEAVIGELR